MECAQQTQEKKLCCFARMYRVAEAGERVKLAILMLEIVCWLQLAFHKHKKILKRYFFLNWSCFEFDKYFLLVF